ncbi:hypothetical protein OROMI_021112 [Orobanche minor]
MAPKNLGGLGAGSLLTLNLALMAKWWWRHKLDNSSLWSQVISSIHRLNDKPADYISRKTNGGVWNNIAGAKKDIEKFGLRFYDILKKTVNSGTSTLFWLDEWIADGKLKDQFPNLYQIEQKKRCLVGERITDQGLEWDWACNTQQAGLSTMVAQLNAIVGNFSLGTTTDDWSCGLDATGVFSISAVRTRMLTSGTNFMQDRVEWIKEAPMKVITFIWRAKMGRIPSSEALIKRGIPNIHSHCSHCNEVGTNCALGKTTGHWIFRWCGIGDVVVNSVTELIEFAQSWGNSKKEGKLFTLVCYGMLWLMWLAINDRIFKQRIISPTLVADNIKSLVFVWVKHRGVKKNIKWVDWNVSPFLCL